MRAGGPGVGYGCMGEEGIPSGGGTRGKSRPERSLASDLIPDTFRALSARGGGGAPVCASYPDGSVAPGLVATGGSGGGRQEQHQNQKNNMTMTLMTRNGLRLGVAAALGLACGAALAQNKPAEQTKWETTATAGATLTRGNSDTFLGTLSLDTKRKWESDEAAFGITGGFGETKINGDTQKNTEYVKGFGQYNRLFNERLYGGIRVDGEYDGIAGVDYRFRVSPLLGYYVVKNPRTTLAFEAGPSVVFEQLEGGDSDTYLGARFGERFEHKLTDTTKVWQSLEYIPDVERWTEKYLLVAEAGIDAAITKKMGLRVVLQDNYDSEPSAGRDGNDLRLIAGVRYRF